MDAKFTTAYAEAANINATAIQATLLREALALYESNQKIIACHPLLAVKILSIIDKLKPSQPNELKN